MVMFGYADKEWKRGGKVRESGGEAGEKSYAIRGS